MVRDLLEPGPGVEALEDLDDDRSLLGVGLEDRLVVACPGASRVGVWELLELVPVGRSAAVAVALAGVLSLSPAYLAAELLDLELVQRLKHVSH